MRAKSGPSIAFQVECNGDRVCVAGLRGRPGVVTVILHSVLRPDGQELVLDVGGLDSGTATHVTWDTRELAAGDEITVRVVENLRPTRIKRRPPFRSLSAAGSRKRPQAGSRRAG